MVLLRRVIGDALRARRQGQQRTLREVSTAANVSLGYLSEIERGQKEASSELLAAVCDALGARLSEVLREVSDTVELAEQMPAVLVPMQDQPAAAQQRAAAESTKVASGAGPASSPMRHVTVPAGHAGTPSTEARLHRVRGGNVRKVATDSKVSASVRQDYPLPAAGPNSPLRATLTTTRRVRSAERDVVCAA